MKKYVWTFGLISGTIVSLFMAVSMAVCYYSDTFSGSMFIGYLSMIVSFSFIFIGVRNYRDKYAGGSITFGKAFVLGLWIAVIASTMYALAWMVEYHFFMPDFLTKHSATMINEAKTSGQTATEISDLSKNMVWAAKMYENPVTFFLITFAEIFPVGLVVALVTAAFLKRRDVRSVE